MWEVFGSGPAPLLHPMKGSNRWISILDTPPISLTKNTIFVLVAVGPQYLVLQAERVSSTGTNGIIHMFGALLASCGMLHDHGS